MGHWTTEAAATAPLFSATSSLSQATAAHTGYLRQPWASIKKLFEHSLGDLHLNTVCIIQMTSSHRNPPNLQFQSLKSFQIIVFPQPHLGIWGFRRGLLKQWFRNFDISRFWSVLSDCCSQVLNILQITFILHFLHSIFYDLIWDTTQILLGREENIKLYQSSLSWKLPSLS